MESLGFNRSTGELLKGENGNSGKLTRLVVVGTVLAVALGNWLANAQDVNSLPNPFSVVENWARLPTERAWGQVIGVEIDPDGQSVWVLDRCGPKGCMDPIGKTINPIQKFDRDGKLIISFGAGLFNWPHGFFVDREGNVWATDGIGVNGKGNTVFKFSAEGKILMMLGQPGVAGDGQDTFNWPSDVVVGMNGDIFIADGHGGKSNARIVKFSKDGKFIRAWGKEGAAAGEFDVPHGLAIDVKADCLSRTGPITGSRYLTRTEHLSTPGRSSADRADFSSTSRTRCTSPIRSRVKNTMRRSAKAFGSAARATGASRPSFATPDPALRRALPPTTEEMSSPQTLKKYVRN